MSARFVRLALLSLIWLSARIDAQTLRTADSDRTLRVILLGTAGGPTFSAQRLGISTLILAGPEKLLFDCGRGMTTGMAALGINPADVTKVFLTHLHSDHFISLPELYLFPWASQGRNRPLQVWGPDGTRSMLKHLQEAFKVDIHIRRDVDEKFSAEVSGLRAPTFARESFMRRMVLRSPPFSSTTGLLSRPTASVLTIKVTRWSCRATRSPLTTS